MFFDSTQAVPRDPKHLEGWDLDPGTLTLTVFGTACQKLQAGQVQDLSIVFGCPTEN